MYILLAILWLVWEIKYVLFWLYLWQLKDYHLPRFVDHFRTYKGKKLILNFEQILKLALFVFLFFTTSVPNLIYSVIFLVYLVELALFARGIINKSFKKPIKTAKILLLSAISFVLLVLFFVFELGLSNNKQILSILISDILTPIIVSVIVLLFQPIFVFLRNKTLRDAKEKIEKIKSAGSLKVIAITGSYGKTSTKEFLTTILSKKFKVLSTNKHQNAEVGIANCILQDLNSSHQIFIAEVGAYDKGKVKEVCLVLKPQIGIVTGVNEQHLALFGSMKNLLSAEGGGELANALPKDGLLVVNGDNKYCLGLYKEYAGNKKIYSISNKLIDSDIWSEEVEVGKDFISFVAINKNKEMAHFGVKVLGKQNVQNLLGAILIARELGMNFEEISEACNGIFQEQAGMTLKQEKHEINVIDSSYSANPDGVFADLEYLRIFEGEKVVVMPCLIELGERSSEIHEKIGQKMGEICDLAIITSKDKYKEIEKGFNEKKLQGAKCLLCDNSQNIYSMITLFCKQGDAVLLEGRVTQKLIDLLKQ